MSIYGKVSDSFSDAFVKEPGKIKKFYNKTKGSLSRGLNRGLRRLKESKEVRRAENNKRRFLKQREKAQKEGLSSQPIVGNDGGGKRKRHEEPKEELVNRDVKILIFS